MIEPTESESRVELDRFIDAMIHIRQEIDAVESGVFGREDNPLRNAPHTIDDMLDENWQRSYTKRQAAFPPCKEPVDKFWPCINRIDNVYGDRNLFCAPPLKITRLLTGRERHRTEPNKSGEAKCLASYI